MKKILLSLSLLSVGVITMPTSMIAQSVNKFPVPSPLQTVTQQLGLGEVKLEYSRPSAKGRVVFGDLVPYGKIWRTGANSSAKITFTEKMNIGGKIVEPGTYAIYTIPNANEWTVMLYKDLKLGGNVAGYDNAQELLRFNVPVVKTANAMETFSMTFDNVSDEAMDLMIGWEKSLVKVTIKEDNLDSKIMKNIEQAMKVDPRTYYQAASYYYQTNKDQKQALEWTNKALESNPNAFWMQAQKARIQLKLNDKKGAAETAQKVIDLSREAKNEDYEAIGKSLLQQAK